MPRKWSNGGGAGGGSLNHRFVQRTPVMTADYRAFDEILHRNASIASKEKLPRRT